MVRGNGFVFWIFIIFVIVVGGIFVLIGVLYGDDTDTGDENQQPSPSQTSSP